MMKTIPLQNHNLPQAGRLFAQAYTRLRQAVPILPDRYEHPETFTDRLTKLLKSGTGLAVVEDGELLGFLGWIYADRFRETPRKAAYCPEWAHAASEGSQSQVYRLLYTAAAKEWTEAHCQTHAISLLAYNQVAESFWFWNGFGLTGVDAIRPLTPWSDQRLPSPRGLTDAGRPSTGLSVRKASLADLDELMRLDAEHWAYYLEPPTLMAPQVPRSAGEMAELVVGPVSSVWTAWQDNRLTGFVTFAGNNFGAADIVRDESTVAINGAFVHPEFRGLGIGAAILAAAFETYDSLGYTRCSVDFESFNPSAAAFWLRYFEPVCLSVIRVPERFEQEE